MELFEPGRKQTVVVVEKEDVLTFEGLLKVRDFEPWSAPSLES